MGWFGRSAARSVNAANDGPDIRKSSDPVLATFERQAALSYPDLAPAQAVRRMMDAYAYLMADGDDLEMRVAVESRMLARTDPHDLADRFEHTPLPRIDPYPDGHDARLEWIADVLRSERREVADGRMTLQHALVVAAYDRGEIPLHVRNGETVVGAGPSRAGEAEIEAAVHQIARMPSRLLFHRFRHVPGVVEHEIPPEGRLQDRLFWIENALKAAETRELCGLSASDRDHGVPMVRGLDIGFTDIEMEGTPEGRLVFAGRLLISGQQACILSSQGDGRLDGQAWESGFRSEDLAVLDAYVRMSCPLRDDGDGERETGLMDLILDQVMTRVATMTYRSATADVVLFVPDGDGQPLDLLAVPVPPGGSRRDAIEHLRSHHPSAVVLDEMEEVDAVALWTSLS